MRYLYQILFVAFISASVSAQVDTLGAVYMGSIQTSSNIRELYIEDLDGDEIKEIIIAANYNVHVYDGITYQEIWTSPDMIAPRDLKFSDLNNDGLLDLAVKQSYFYPQIYLLDPHNSQTLWTSPIVDDSLRCYAVGDRNADGAPDIAIVRKEPFTRYNVENNMDTVWMYIYDGPAYDSIATVVMTFPNFEVDDGWMIWVMSQFPTDVEICSIGDTMNSTPGILLFIQIDDVQESSYPFISTYYGMVRVFDAEDMTVKYDYAAGNYISGNVYSLQNNNTYKYYSRSIGISDLSTDLTIYEIALSNDTTAYQDILFYDTNSGPPYPPFLPIGFDWLLNDEVNQNYPNKEVAFAYSVPWPEESRLCLYDEMNGNQIWWLLHLQYLTNRAFTLSYPSIFNSPKIVFQYDTPYSKYHLLNGETGEIDGVINLISDIIRIDNANNDLDDELFVKTSNNVLSVYSLELLTDVKERAPKVFDIDLSNYPNPFNSQTTIEYGLQEAGRIRIDIFDLLGRKVKTLVDEERQAGSHRVVWDASGHSSGVYFYRIEAGDYVDIKRMVYLK